MRDRLAAWLRATVGAPVTVGALTTPAAGMSNDTLLTTIDRGDGDEGIVVRLAPEGLGLFPVYDLDAQVAVLRALASTDVPVPEVLWHEQDPAALGRPFFVMRRVEGRIPPDGHHFGGWLLELPAADQARLLDGALDVLARIHAVQVDPASLGVLDRPGYGANPIDQELGSWRAHLDWAADGERLARLEDAYDWCVAHRPADAPRGLVWGDARLGNLIVDDALAPVAVLDWEMAVLGPPELDVGWFLFLDRTALQYAEQLPGFPDRDGLVAACEQRLGRPLRDLDWYEAWAGFRAACIQVRLAETPEARERNPVTKALRGLLI